MRIRIFLFAALLSSTSLVRGQELTYFLKLAFENHPQLKAAGTRYQTSLTKEQQYSALRDPMLSAGYNVLPEGMEKANVSLMQNFAWFGTTRHQKAAANAAAQSNAHSLEALKRQIAIDISNLYFQLQENQQLTEIQQQISDAYKSLEELANNKLSTSQGSLADVIRAQIEEDNIKNEIQLLRESRKTLIFSLNKLTGRDEQDSIKIVPVSYKHFSGESPIDKHPEVEAIDSRIAESNEQVMAAKKESLPDLGIGVEYMRMHPSGNEIMPMLSISLPIYRKKYKARIEEARLQGVAYEQDKQWTLNQLSRQRDYIRVELLNAEKSLSLYQDQITKTENAKELLLTYYSTSGADFREILRLQNEELNYRVMTVKTQIRALMLSKQWEYLNNQPNF